MPPNKINFLILEVCMNKLLTLSNCIDWVYCISSSLQLIEIIKLIDFVTLKMSEFLEYNNGINNTHLYLSEPKMAQFPVDFK